jgi:membrane-associated phospholipid phosphatase
LRFPLFTLIALVGVSRFYLGVHYPSDVVGGLAVGAAWGAAVMLVFNGRHSA